MKLVLEKGKPFDAFPQWKIPIWYVTSFIYKMLLTKLMYNEFDEMDDIIGQNRINHFHIWHECAKKFDKKFADERKTVQL